MRTFLFVTCALALIAGGFAWDKPWLWGLGLLVGLGAMFGDKDPIQLDGRDKNTETTMSLRRMRSKDL